MALLKKDGYFMRVTKGAILMDVIKEACERATLHYVNIAFEYNGTLVYVTPRSDPQEVAEAWAQKREEADKA